MVKRTVSKVVLGLAVIGICGLAAPGAGYGVDGVQFKNQQNFQGQQKFKVKPQVNKLEPKLRQKAIPESSKRALIKSVKTARITDAYLSSTVDGYSGPHGISDWCRGHPRSSYVTGYIHLKYEFLSPPEGRSVTVRLETSIRENSYVERIMLGKGRVAHRSPYIRIYHRSFCPSGCVLIWLSPVNPSDAPLINTYPVEACVRE